MKAVGNDVVDLGDARTADKARDERFLARVFDRAGIDAVRGSEDPDVELWCRWAAKEAAYKVTSKLLGTPPVFEHRAFVVEWFEATRAPEPELRSEVELADGADGAVAGEPLRRGVVRYRDLRAAVRVDRQPGLVHAVAVGSPLEPGPLHARLVARVDALDADDRPWTGSLEELLGRLSSVEAEPVRSRRSAAVRLGARADLARALSIEEGRVEIACAPGTHGRRPPLVLVDGRRAPVDVSLSHDGRWIAWAFWPPGGE